MTCPLLDAFTRADGPIGADWQLPTGTTNYDVVSNELVFDGGAINWALWVDTGPFADCCSSIKWVAVAGGSPVIWTGVRLDVDPTQDSGFVAGYTVEWHSTSFTISKWGVAFGSPAEFELTTSSVSFTRALGDVLGITASGVGTATDISATQNGVVLATVNDQDNDGPMTPPSDSGQPGIQVNSSFDVTLDDFRAGEDVVPALDGIDLSRVMFRVA